MRKNEEWVVLSGALSKWGGKFQIDMAVEEMAELIKALMKYMRKINGSSRYDVVEEIVDVEIMIDQLKLIFVDNGVGHEHYSNVRDRKMERLKEMVGNHIFKVQQMENKNEAK